MTKPADIHYHPCTLRHRTGKSTSKLNPLAIQRLYESGLTQKQIAECFDVGQSRISQILDRSGRVANMKICHSTIIHGEV